MKISKPVQLHKLSPPRWIIFILGFGRIDHQRQRSATLDKLQYQRFLLRSGMDAKADVMDVETKGEVTYNLQEVSLLLRIHFPGQTKETLIHTSTLVGCHGIPQPGDRINVRYIPGKTSMMLIL